MAPLSHGSGAIMWPTAQAVGSERARSSLNPGRGDRRRGDGPVAPSGAGNVSGTWRPNAAFKTPLTLSSLPLFPLPWGEGKGGGEFGRGVTSGIFMVSGRPPADGHERLLRSCEKINSQEAHTCRRFLSACMRRSWSEGRRHAKSRHVCATREIPDSEPGQRPLALIPETRYPVPAVMWLA